MEGNRINLEIKGSKMLFFQIPFGLKNNYICKVSKTSSFFRTIRIWSFTFILAVNQYFCDEFMFLIIFLWSKHQRYNKWSYFSERVIVIDPLLLFEEKFLWIKIVFGDVICLKINGERNWANGAETVSALRFWFKKEKKTFNQKDGIWKFK